VFTKICYQTTDMLVTFHILTATSIYMTVFWAIALTMEAVNTSETSVNFYQTRSNISETVIFKDVQFS
jgi:hypothetical protein